MDFIPPELHAGIRDRTNVKDLSAFIQAAIDTYASQTAPTARVYLPRGSYRIEKTLILKGHQILEGDLGDVNVGGLPGTELVWRGPDGGTALITGTSDEEDWSRSGIESLAITNASAVASGWGVKIRNPQNGSHLRHVYVRGFPTCQVLAYEAPGRKSGVGTTPGYWFIEDLFAVGGKIPVVIEAGIEQTEVRNLKVDTDARSTVGALFKRAPAAEAQGAPVLVQSSFVEIQPGTEDIHGFEWSGDLPITFLSSGVQRNSKGSSSKAAFFYSNASRKLPTAELINCTSWQMGLLYRFEAAGLAVAPANISVPESFVWTRARTDAALTFGRANVVGGMRGPVHALGLAGATQGLVMHRPGTIVGASLSYTGPVSAGAVTVRVLKNGLRAVRALTLAPGHAFAFEDFIAGNVISGPDFHFDAGDRIGAELETEPLLDPVGAPLVVEVFVRFR
jgi:hypothetical protein